MMTVVVTATLVMALLVGWGVARADEGRWRVSAILPLIVLVMVGLVPMLIRWPVISTFGLYALLAPFDSVATLAEAMGATVTRFVGMLAGAVLLAVGLVERRLVPPPVGALWWGLFTLWAVMSAAWAIDLDRVYERFQTMLSLVALYFVAVSFRVSAKELSWVCVLSVVGGVMAAGTGYFLGFDEGGRGVAGRGRLTLGDEYHNPNHLAAVLVLPLAVAIGAFIGLRGAFSKTVAMVAVAVMAAGLYITMSRRALVGLAVVLLVFLYRFRVRFPILVVIAVLLGLTALMPERFIERITSVFTGQDDTGAGRTELWAMALGVVNEHWAIGVGLAGGPGPHNTYLSTWAELGIIGLGLMLAAVISHLLAAARTRGGEGGAWVALHAIEAACFGGLALAFFGDALWKKYFWLPWMLLSWATRVAQERTETHNPKHEDETVPIGLVSAARRKGGRF